MTEHSDGHLIAPLPPALRRASPVQVTFAEETVIRTTPPRERSASLLLSNHPALLSSVREPPTTFDGDNHARANVDKVQAAAAAQIWLQDRGFSEREIEAVEALLEEFDAKVLAELGEEGVRARIRELIGGATDDVRPSTQRSSLSLSREFAGNAVGQCSCNQERRVPRGRSVRPPLSPEHVTIGMFLTLHKNEGRSPPHRRFFRFDPEHHIVSWSKRPPKKHHTHRPDSRSPRSGKYAKVVAAQADIPAVRANRGLDTRLQRRCLRLQTMTHGTLNLEMQREADAELWLSVVRDAGLPAESLDDVLREETKHQDVDQHSPSAGSSRSLSKMQDEVSSVGGSSGHAVAGKEGHYNDTGNDIMVMGAEEDTIETELHDGEHLDDDDWNKAREAFHKIAERNVDTLKSKYEAMATDAVHKFLHLGPEAEVVLLDSLVRRDYQRGEDLIKQGDDGKEFFVLLDGVVRVIADDKYIRTVKAPNAFGESALIQASKRTGTVRAESDTVRVAILSKMMFDRLQSQRDYPKFWHRSSLKTKFSAAHLKYLGQTGEIVNLHPQSNEVEVEFQDGVKLRFPSGALGVLPISHEEYELDDCDPIFRYCDAPTNSETQALGIMEDWMLRGWDELRLARTTGHAGRKVAVMRDVNVAKSYFQRIEEVYHVDQYALATSTWYFIAAWVLGSILGFNLASFLIGVLLVIASFFSERSRHQQLYSEVQTRVHETWNRAVEHKTRQESPEWINRVLEVSWGQMGVEKQLSQQIKDQTNPMLSDMSTWYPQVNEIKLESLSLGQNPPRINNLHFENSDVFGEFRVNMEARLDAPDCLAKVCVDLKSPKSMKTTVMVENLNINVDFQLLVRLSSDNGLTLLGVKLLKELGLDYTVVKSGMLFKDLTSIGGFPVQKALNQQIHDSLWWMTAPCMLLLPWYPAADSCSPSFLPGSDLEASQYAEPVGLLQIRIKSAKNLPIADWVSQSSDPYVQLCVEKSYPLRQFKTRTLKKNLNPVFEESFTTTLRWNESQTGVLLFEVFDHNQVGHDDKLGMAELPIKIAVKQYTKSSSEDIALRLRELSDATKRESHNHEAPVLHLSITFFHKFKRARVSMASVTRGVLQLEVVSVKNLFHDMEKLYAAIKYGKDSNHYRSEQVDPEDCFNKMEENDRYKRGYSPVVWRDMPVGFKAYHEICVEDLDEEVQICIMEPSVGKDKCLAKFSAPTVPELLEDMGLLEVTDHCLNGVTKEKWLHLTASNCDRSVGEQVTKFGKRAIVDPTIKGMKGVGRGVKGARESVSRRINPARSSDHLVPDENEFANSDDDYGLNDFEDGGRESGSEYPQVRLAAAFIPCRTSTDQAHDRPNDDWRPQCNGTLSVRLISASNLIPADSNGLSDPYANISLGFQEQVSANDCQGSKRSKVKKKTLDPHWDESFLFRVKQASTAADNMLQIAVFDWDALQANDFLGSAVVDLTNEFCGKWIDHEIDKHFVLKDPELRCNYEFAHKVRGKKQHGIEQDESPLGQVHLRITFHPDLDRHIARRGRGVSIMNLADTLSRTSSEMHASTDGLWQNSVNNSTISNLSPAPSTPKTHL